MRAASCSGITRGVLLSSGWRSWSVSGFAQTNAITHSPAKVVEKYFALDNKGVASMRLPLSAVANLVEWKEEPVWGKVIVINGFTVPDDFRKWEIVNRLEVWFPVEFQVLGSCIWIRPVLCRNRGRNRRGFASECKGGDRWKIVEPILPPHVGQKRVLNFVRQALFEEKTEPARAAGLAGRFAKGEMNDEENRYRSAHF